MKYAVCLVFFLFLALGHAQDPTRFKDQVEEISKKYDAFLDPLKETIVFTGSSSIRIWNDLQDCFPNHQIVNSGFGGSQASDLLFYSNDLILRYKPKKVFIYEGDNDIKAKKKTNGIIKTTQQIIDSIRKNDPNTEIVLIAAKPSIARWQLRRKYKRLNRKFKKLAQKDRLLDYADVWKPMLDSRKVKQDIFIEDGLHMNAKGYEIWYGVIKDFLN